MMNGINNKRLNTYPQNAVILAAGFGVRMVPINLDVPKGLIEINGEPLIERSIKQLHEAGIFNIYVIVGFMKERYEYLKKKYDVILIENEEYSSKNNLHSLKLALNYLSNTYIIPCDIWCAQNPYSNMETCSWYMVKEILDQNSTVRANEKMELLAISEKDLGNAMIGICYLQREHSIVLKKRIETLCENRFYDNSFWEDALFSSEKILIYAKMVSSQEVLEINTYEQLREVDNHSSQLESDAINIICKTLNVNFDKINNIKVLKKGMTNRSFSFLCNEKKYIMRIPGEGTDQLINRRQEAAVYKAIKEKHICDEIIYFDSENGYKITEYVKGARVCNPFNHEDVKKCMNRLREFHNLRIKVNHKFDIFEQIEFYENLWNGKASFYEDYEKTKSNVYSLKTFIEKFGEESVLTHIDAVPDNFLFAEKDGRETIYLIDWEYAGMQDPHVDIAMFAIYSFYDIQQINRLISAYFPEGCNEIIRIKIYCYVSVCGLLWSNWCEYKRNMGVEFGNYSLRQYQYAKEFYEIVQKELRIFGDEIECTEQKELLF